jgi:hypothetical protein
MECIGRREWLERARWSSSSTGRSGSGAPVRGLRMQSFGRVLCRAMVATRERPLSPSLTFSAA